jgi:DNA repair exonuclease SbcCD ATPase subunit
MIVGRHSWTPQRITMRNIGAPGTRFWDLTATHGPLVGLAGPNGIGKTMLLECLLPGAWFGFLPSPRPIRKGSAVTNPNRITAVAIAADSLLEVDWLRDDGKVFTFRHEMNGPRDEWKPHLLCDGVAYEATVDGVALKSDGKITVFKRLVESLIGTWELVAASAFWVQGGGGSFSRLNEADGRSMFGDLIGNQKHDAVFAAATPRWQEAKRHLETATSNAIRAAEVAALHAESMAAVKRSEAEAEAARAIVTSAEEVLTTLTAELKSARAAADASASAAVLDRVVELKAALAVAERKVTAATIALRGAEAAKVAADTAYTELQTQARAVEVANQTRREAIRRHEAAVSAAAEAARREVAALEPLAKGIGPEPQVDASTAEAERLEAETQTTRDEYRAAADRHRAVDELRQKLAALQNQVGPLADVPCGGRAEADSVTGKPYAACGLIAGAVKAREAMPLTQAAIDEAAAGLPDLTAIQTRGKEVGARATEARRVAQEASQAHKAWQAQSRAHAAAEATAKAASAAVIAAREAVTNAEAAIPAEVEAVTGVSDAGHRFDVATDALGIARSQVAVAEAEVTRCRTELGRLPTEEALRAAVSADAGDHRPVAIIEDAIDTERRRQNGARETASAASATLQSARANAGRAEDAASVLAKSYGYKDNGPPAVKDSAAAALDTAKATLASYEAIRAAFGPKGIPAVRTALAAPWISLQATKLLEGCYGAQRFVLDVVTQEGDGDKTRDCFRVLVQDNEKMISGEPMVSELRGYSGGQATVLDSALRLAILFYRRENDGVDIRVVIADEMGAALDPEHTALWVQMQRAAALEGRLDKMIFVSHDAAARLQLNTIVNVTDLDTQDVAKAA